MKVNELMIGDWASLSETDDIVPCVVTALHPEDLFVIQPGEDAGYVLSYDTIYPIPLTAEILEKNGIKKRGDKYVVFRWERAKQWYVSLEDFKPQFDFWFIESTGRGFNVRGEIRFVHELQHALRLCGLNDLADNFRV